MYRNVAVWNLIYECADESRKEWKNLERKEHSLTPVLDGNGQLTVESMAFKTLDGVLIIGPTDRRFGVLSCAPWSAIGSSLDRLCVRRPSKRPCSRGIKEENKRKEKVRKTGFLFSRMVTLKRGDTKCGVHDDRPLEPHSLRSI